MLKKNRTSLILMSLVVLLFLWAFATVVVLHLEENAPIPIITGDFGPPGEGSMPSIALEGYCYPDPDDDGELYCPYR